MDNGIVIFGANGCGKTTLACELSHKLNFKHIDIKDYSFEELDMPYSEPCSKDTVIDLMLSDIEKCNSFVFSTVAGDYGAKIVSMYRLGLFRPTWTPNISGDKSISELRRVEINNISLEIMIRGNNSDNPIIIFVHGGPYRRFNCTYKIYRSYLHQKQVILIGHSCGTYIATMATAKETS